jgi:hypothetical protein
MSIPPVPYDSLNQSIVPSGAWGWELDNIDVCRAYISFIPSSLACSLSLGLGFVYYLDYSSDVYYIECSLDTRSPLQTLYHPTLEANISINLANYGGATTLNLFVFCYFFRVTLFIKSCSTWTYRQIYYATNIAAGTSIPVYSQVGDAGFDDSFPSAAYGSFNTSTWNNSMYALGSKTISLKYFISSQNLSQWLYIRRTRQGSDYWIHYAQNKRHNVGYPGSSQ